MKIKLKKIINGHYLNVFITRFGLAGVLLVVMIVIYITLRYTSDKTVRNIKEIDSEVVQLKQKSNQYKQLYQNAIRMQSLTERLRTKKIEPSDKPVNDIIIIK